MGYFLSYVELGMAVKMMDVDGDEEIIFDECSVCGSIQREMRS
jgi:hypothetical protein